MDWDEPKATRPAGHTVGQPLDDLSMADLEARVSSLEGEIERLRAELQRKKAHEAAASELFTGKS